MAIDPNINPFSIPLKSRPRKPKASKHQLALLEKLKQPALLSNRVQPVRRPKLRLKPR